MSEGSELDEAEQPRAPSPEAQAVMEAHLQDEHDVDDFSLERHVHFRGPRQAAQVLGWNAANATFFCERCRRLVWTEEITPEMISRARLFDERLQPHLVGLYEAEDRDEMAGHYLSGRVNQGRLRQLRGASSRRRAAAASRPAVNEQRRKVQAWMLDQYARLGTVERVLDAAVALQRDDPDVWARLALRGLARETLRKYWQDIDESEKRNARELFERRRHRRS